MIINGFVKKMDGRRWVANLSDPLIGLFLKVSKEYSVKKIQSVVCSVNGCRRILKADLEMN